VDWMAITKKDFDNVLWMGPCLPFGDSLFGHYDDPFFQPLINDYAGMIPEHCAKQESCTLPVTGAITKLSTSRKSISMATKLLASDSQAPTDVFELPP